MQPIPNETKLSTENNYVPCMTCVLLYFLNKSYIITLNNKKLEQHLDNYNFLTIESINNKYITYNIPSMISKQCIQTYYLDLQNGINEIKAQKNYITNKRRYTTMLLIKILESNGIEIIKNEDNEVIEIKSIKENSREWLENDLLCKGYDVYMKLYTDFKYISRKIYEMNAIF